EEEWVDSTAETAGTRSRHSKQGGSEGLSTFGVFRATSKTTSRSRYLRHRYNDLSSNIGRAWRSSWTISRSKRTRASMSARTIPWLSRTTLFTRMDERSPCCRLSGRTTEIRISARIRGSTNQVGRQE
ncbi:hypothetical protein JG687_00017579, partial [Phytophthora cactorum]